MKPHYFLAACVLAMAALVPLGAPAGPVAVGIVLGTLLTAFLKKPAGGVVRKVRRKKQPTS